MKLLWTLLFLSCAQMTPEQKKNYEKDFLVFLDKIFEENIQQYPTVQTYLGKKTNYHKLDQHTEAFSKKEHQRVSEQLTRLRKYDRSVLSADSKLHYDIMEYQLEENLKAYKWRYHSYPLNQMFGFHSSLPGFMINMHLVDSKEDAQAYLSRLVEFKRVFDERIVYLEKQLSMGILPPHFVWDRVRLDSQNIITGYPFQGAGQSPLYKDFQAKVRKLKIGAKKKKQLIETGTRHLKNYVGPAYKKLIAQIDKMKKHSRENHGAWNLPSGREFYNFLLWETTSTKLDANEIHQIGLREVGRIHLEMTKLLPKIPFKGKLPAFFKELKTNKSYSYANTERGRQLYLKKAKAIIKNMKKSLPKMFGRLPKADIIVKPVEAYREKSTAMAFYQGPALYGNRPGIYYVNLFKLNDNPKYRMEALAYHEGVPGHHMQIALKTEQKNVPLFRRTTDMTAFEEGWALYAERVPKEFGFYKDPLSDFGRLTWELWRATRLVVDTGIHAKKWTYQQAVDYLLVSTPNTKQEIIKAVERYFVMPSQATAYKIGMLKILELRKKYQEKMGSKFDIRKFHDHILGLGPMPFPLLEENLLRRL